MRRRSRRALWPLLVVLAGAPLAPQVASAEPPLTPAQRRGARVLFDEADKLMDGERWADALAKLESLVTSYKAAETPAVMFYTGLCKSNLGRLRDALRDYERARVMLAADTKSPARERKALEDKLGESITELEARVPHVQLRPEPDDPEVASLRITIDGAEVEAARVVDAPLALDPGEHKLNVEAPQRKPLEREFSLREKQTLDLRLGLALIAPPPPPPKKAPPPPPPPSGGTRKAFGYGFLGLGIAGLLAGGAHVTADRIVGNKDDNADLISISALGVGVLGLGAGIYLLATGPSSAPPPAAALDFRPTGARAVAADLPALRWVGVPAGARSGTAFTIGGSFLGRLWPPTEVGGSKHKLFGKAAARGEHQSPTLVGVGLPRRTNRHEGSSPPSRGEL